MYQPLVPATLAFSAHGTPYSAQYDDIYHSESGGPGQARHVFLAGNRLPERWRGRDHFTLLETGFGTGLNFLSTWQAWQDDPQACRRLHYVSLEKHPFRPGDLAAIHAHWPEFAGPAAQLRALWPILTPGFHRLELAGGRLILTLLLGDAAQVLGKLDARADAIYLDGFAPGKNPDLWSPEILKHIGRLAAPGATLATWSVSAAVRGGLQEAGFELEKRQGYSGKREMLTGRLGTARAETAPPERSAIVIGAGVAGCTACERLASRDWDITLIDRRDSPATEASGNLAGILMPRISKDDNIAARLSRSALLYALRHWRPDAFPAARLGLTGVFQIARDPDQEQLQRDVVARLGFPPEFIDYLDQQAASDLLGHDLPAGGWLFRQAGWANPPSLCRASLEAAGTRIRPLYGQAVSSLRRDSGRWLALDGTGRVLADAGTVILANGHEAGRIAEATPLPIQRVRGQVTLVPQGAMPDIRLALCREGYAAPAVDGRHAVGASYDFDDDPEPRLASTAGNLERLAGLLPSAVLDLQADMLANRVGFRPVLPDRLPLMGALPDWDNLPSGSDVRLPDLPRLPGLYGLLGYASRGLVWARLLAEALACRLEGEPMPMETDLLAAVDPGRFAVRAMKRANSNSQARSR